MPLHVFLLFALLVANVLMRTLTNGLHVLPKFLNVIDIPIVALLFLISRFSEHASLAPAWTRTVSRKALGFLLVLFLGCVLNPDYVFLPAAVSQITMLLEPLLLFIAVINLPFSRGDVASYTRMLKWLLIFEVVLGVLQLPIRVATGDSEAVHGTFTGNAEQYAAFLMIGVFYLLGLVFIYPQKRVRYILAIIAMLTLNLSIDNKASWFGFILSLGLVLAPMGMLKSTALRAAVLLVFVGGLAVFVGFVASKTSKTLYKFDQLIQAMKDGDIGRLGKVKAYLDIAHSHLTHPHMLLVGAGPSNFYSRASRQFYFSEKARDNMYLNPNSVKIEVQSEENRRASRSMGGVLSLTTRTPYYSRFFKAGHQIRAVGSIQVDSPFSPYGGLLGETGIIGTFLYLSIYFLVLRQLLAWVRIYRSNHHVLPLLISTIGLLVYIMANSVYGPFLETTRLTTILWSLVSIVCILVRFTAKQGEGKSETRAQQAEASWAAANGSPLGHDVYARNQAFA